ncbi:MAG: alpha/beta fold hydrolase [Acidimicrobiales bacterium]
MSEIEPQVRRLRGEGVTLAALLWPGRGIPIVAVHGVSSNAMFYVGVAERLAGRRPLLSLDLRGRGDSDKPDNDYGMARHADDVAAAMTEAGIERAVIVGHSMGASVAWAVSQRHPARCAGIVLYDGGPHAFADYFGDAALVREFAESSRSIEDRLRRTFASDADYRTYWEGLGIFAPGPLPPWAQRYIEYDLSAGAGDRPVKCDPNAVAADAADLLQHAGDLADARSAVPVMAIRASDGMVDGTTQLVSDASCARTSAACPAFEEHLIPHANHYTVSLTDPPASTVADLLVDFADRCGC